MKLRLRLAPLPRLCVFGCSLRPNEKLGHSSISMLPLEGRWRRIRLMS